MYGRNLRAYRNTSVNAELSVADPYVITKMLYQGIFERLAQAKGAIARGDLEQKASRLSSATAIIENLKDTLDFSQSKEIATNLKNIYNFMLNCIADAAIEISEKPIDEALKVFMPIKEAWDKIPVAAQTEAIAKRNTSQFHNEFNHTRSLAHGTI